MGDDRMTVFDVAKELNRSHHSVRDYHRVEGLPFRKVGRSGRLIVSRADFEEWRSREEIREMLALGDILKHGRKAMQAKRAALSA